MVLFWPRPDIRAFSTWTNTAFLPAEAVRGIHLLLSQRMRLAGEELHALRSSLERLAEAWKGPLSTLAHPAWNPERDRALLDIERVDLLLRARVDELGDVGLARFIEHLEALELYSRRWETDSIVLVMTVATCGHPDAAARFAAESLTDLRGPEWYRPWVEWLSGADVSPERLAAEPLVHGLEGLAVRSEWGAVLGEGDEELRRYDELEGYDPDGAIHRPLVEFLRALARLRLGRGTEEAAEAAFRRWFGTRHGSPMLTLTERVTSVYLAHRELRRSGTPSELLASLRPEVNGLEPPIAPTFEIPSVAQTRLGELIELSARAVAEDTSLASNPVPDGVELLLGDEPASDDETSFADVL